MTDTDVFSRYFQLCEEAGLLGSVSFELTDACNFSCTHCYRVHGRTHLSREIFFKALAEAEAMGVIMVSFNGGEPLVHPDFLEFAAEVLRRGMHLTVLTNAWHLTEPVLDALAPWAPNVHFQVSLYGTDDASALAITGVEGAHGRAFSHALAAMQRGFSVKVALLALQATAPGMPGLTARLEAAGLPYDIMFFLSAREDGDTSVQLLAPDDDALRALLPLRPVLPRETDEMDPALPAPSASSSLEDSPACGAGVTSLSVRADGRILPCQVFNTWPIFGYEPQVSLQEAFSSPARAAFLQANRTPGECLSCGMRRFCLRCPADVLHETGRLTGVPPSSCRVARIRQEWESKKSAPPP